MSTADCTLPEKAISSPLEKGNLHPLLRIICRLDARRRKKAAPPV